MTDYAHNTPPPTATLSDSLNSSDSLPLLNDFRRSSDAQGTSSFRAVQTDGQSPAEGVPVDEIVARLEELRLATSADPQLSQEQLSINDQLQQDELLALEAIYGDNVVVLDKRCDLRLCQINIINEVPSKHTVSVELNSFAQKRAPPNGESSDNRDGQDGQDGFLYTFDVQYLPPLLLACLLPSSYPSHSSPCFIIYADWLDSSRISVLCCELDKIWLENSGQEVLYQWVEWLHVSALSCLNFDEGIHLGPYGTFVDKDRRAVSGSMAPEADILNMMHFNDKKNSEAFSKSLHDCCICFSEFAGTDFVKLPCKHYFCNQCMETYVNMHVTDGTVHKLVCLDNKCNELIPPLVLKRLLGNDEFERWESLLLRKTLDSMIDLVYCPRCETPCLEDEGHEALCAKCFFSFCSLCRDRRHVGEQCMTPDIKLQILQARQESSNIHEIQRRKELEIINNMLSVREVLRVAKLCPNCKMAISRTEGCNKMACFNCAQFFCYRCNEAIDGYDHFKDGKCVLFPPEAIEQWERQVNARQIIGQIRVQLNNTNHYRCPHCGQMNAKVGNNNHIFCWSCQNYYCALCLKAVHRASNHYRPSGCKQHTWD